MDELIKLFICFAAFFMVVLLIMAGFCEATGENCPVSRTRLIRRLEACTGKRLVLTGAKIRATATNLAA